MLYRWGLRPAQCLLSHQENLLCTQAAFYIWNACMPERKANRSGHGLRLTERIQQVSRMKMISDFDTYITSIWRLHYSLVFFSGWSIASDERDWKYRLSIYYVKPQDTGIYTCATPKGLTHSAVVNVIAVHCNAAHVASTDPHLLIHVEGSRLGQHILFSCSEGFKLVGMMNATCQASGKLHNSKQNSFAESLTAVAEVCANFWKWISIHASADSALCGQKTNNSE